MAQDAGGTARKTMAFTWTPSGTNDFLEIDMVLRRIRKSLSGVVTSGRALLTSGDFPWAFDPRDGFPLASVYPTIEVDVGTGFAWWWRNWQ